MIKLTNWSVIKIIGQNAATFLQGQLTCDVTKIEDGQSCLAALCNHQGRVLAVLLLFKKGIDFFAVMPSCISDQFVQHLTKFAVFSKVPIKNVSDNYTVLGLIGEQIETPSQYQTGKLAPSLAISFGPKELEPDCEIDEVKWKLACISRGIPFIYEKTIATVTPHMLNLHLSEAISFNKGCYVGQEIIARTHYLGKSKRRLHCATVQTEDEVSVGDTLTADHQEVGLIIDSVKTNNHNLILAVIQETAISSDIFYQDHAVALQI